MWRGGCTYIYTKLVGMYRKMSMLNLFSKKSKKKTFSITDVITKMYAIIIIMAMIF